MSNKPPDNPWEDVVLAILAVNSYSLEKAHSHVEGLRSQGLFDPKNLATWSDDEVAERLDQGGYTRGSFMNALFAKRLVALGRFVQDQGERLCERTLRSNDGAAIRTLFQSAKGIGFGPRVAENLFILRNISISPTSRGA